MLQRRAGGLGVNLDILYTLSSVDENNYLRRQKYIIIMTDILETSNYKKR